MKPRQHSREATMAMNNKDRLIEAQHEVRMLSETVIKMHAEIERLRAIIRKVWANDRTVLTVSEQARQIRVLKGEDYENVG
jgi:hypothetical protein